MSWIVRCLRFASFVTCVIVIVSFGIFAIGQTKSAAARQSEQVNDLASTSSAGAAHQNSPPATHESEIHRAIDGVAEKLTAPFSGVVSESSGEWAVRVVGLLLALLVYGFGLGYLARTLRVRL